MTDDVPRDGSAARRLRAPSGQEVVYEWISRTQEVMAFRIGGRLVVCSAICPHMGARLGVDRRRGAIVCPWHGLAFSLPDGASAHHRYRRLHVFRATECDGHVDLLGGPDMAAQTLQRSDHPGEPGAVLDASAGFRVTRQGDVYRTEIRNVSAWPIDIVWENAQDLEHVATLHRRTNDAFELLDVRPAPDGRALYESLIFVARRKLFGVLPVVNFGFRRIVGPYEIRQIDINPTFGVTTALTATLERDPHDVSKTIVVDRLVVSMPWILRPFARLFDAALRHHTRRQCAEDETFRARRHELRRRGINLPASLLHRPLWERTFGDSER